MEFGGSLIRPEATGFGGLYVVNQMLKAKGIDIKGKTVAVSGFGNVNVTQGFVYGQLSRNQTHNAYTDIIGTKGIAVSYTHLDVYKRQIHHLLQIGYLHFVEMTGNYVR